MILTKYVPHIHFSWFHSSGLKSVGQELAPPLQRIHHIVYIILLYFDFYIDIAAALVAGGLAGVVKGSL